MAQHAILRFEKHKGNPARPLEAHHERQKEQYASIDNRFRINVTKVKSRTFECHPIIISTVQMNMLSIGTLTEKYVRQMILHQLAKLYAEPVH